MQKRTNARSYQIGHTDSVATVLKAANFSPNGYPPSPISSTGGYNGQHFNGTTFGSVQGLNGMAYLTHSQRSVSRLTMNGSDIRPMISPRNKVHCDSPHPSFNTMNRTTTTFNSPYEGDTITMLPRGGGGGGGSSGVHNSSIGNVAVGGAKLRPLRGLPSTPRSCCSNLNGHETDSETEYCAEMNAMLKEDSETIGQRLIKQILSAIPLHRQQKAQAVFARCNESIICKFLLLILQFICSVMNGICKELKKMDFVINKLRLRLWRTKIFVRSAVRDMLWRLTNIKGNDTLLYLIVVLATPWLFLLSLIGFIISLVFSCKTIFGNVLRHIRMRLI